jgi:hypothetical protein
MRIYNDENGKAIDYLAERNEEIKEKLENARQILYAEQQKDKSGRKKLGFRMGFQLKSAFRSYGRISVDDFVRLTYEDIEDYYAKFDELIAYYNLYFEIVPNKQLFQTFMGINERQYAQLEKHEDEDIRLLMNSINGDLIGVGFLAGESGNANDKAVMNRLKSADVGHNVVSASEERAIQAVVGKTPQELEREMKAILGGDIKALK